MADGESRTHTCTLSAGGSLSTIRFPEGLLGCPKIFRSSTCGWFTYRLATDFRRQCGPDYTIAKSLKERYTTTVPVRFARGKSSFVDRSVARLIAALYLVQHDQSRSLCRRTRHKRKERQLLQLSHYYQVTTRMASKRSIMSTDTIVKEGRFEGTRRCITGTCCST